MKHVVMFSGGLGSWMSAKRVAERYGTDNLEEQPDLFDEFDFGACGCFVGDDAGDAT